MTETVRPELPPFQKFAKIPRLSRGMIITEKIDGTNAQIVILDEPITAVVDVPRGADVLRRQRTGRIWAGSRKRWILPEHDNFGFAAWVEEHADELIEGLGPGHHYGEWWGQGIQRGYGLDERRFSLFNIQRWGDPTGPVGGVEPPPSCCSVVPVLAVCDRFDTSIIEKTLTWLHLHGSFAAPGFHNPEGVVVCHRQSGHLYKKTFENDRTGKDGVPA